MSESKAISTPIGTNGNLDSDASDNMVDQKMYWSMIETKQVFRNKQDQDGIVVRNKARLVAQGYTQVEDLDFGETYAPVPRCGVWKHDGK